MTLTFLGRVAVASMVGAATATIFTLPASADPDPVPPATAGDAPVNNTPQFGPGPHNVTYRARIDGASRGTVVTYRISDAQLNSATPSLLPGESFESTGVVSDPHNAGMEVSIQWPYTATLHCEILVDDQTVAQNNQFVAPRLTPQRDDPGYGVLSCGSVTDFVPGQQYDTQLPGMAGQPTPAARPPAG